MVRIIGELTTPPLCRLNIGDTPLNPSSRRRLHVRRRVYHFIGYMHAPFCITFHITSEVAREAAYAVGAEKLQAFDQFPTLHPPPQKGCWHQPWPRLSSGFDQWVFPFLRRGGRVVDRTALEMRHTCKRIGGSNPPLSANSLPG